MRRQMKRAVLLVGAQLLVILVIGYIFVKPKHKTTSLWTSYDANQSEEVQKLKNNKEPHLIHMNGPQHLENKEDYESKEDKEKEEEITSVFLLYIPSTLSSSIQNILLRKAITASLNVALPQIPRSLNVALPETYTESLCYPEPFTSKCPLNNAEAPFDMILHQIRYDGKEIASAMKAGRKNIVLLRHPIRQLQAAYYDNDWSDYAHDRSFEEFINDYYMRFAKTYDFDKHLPYRNIQLFMLGFPSSQNEMRDAFTYKIENINHEFHIVMFQELMLESLVLLKHELHWEYQDVTTFGLHANPENYGLDELTKTVNDTIIFYNEGDMKMYEVLLEEFQQKIKDFGIDNMKIEKQLLQYAINEETEKCLEKSEEEMKQPMRRIEQRLTWEAEGDRLCHFYVSRGSELTGLLRMTWDKKERERKQAQRKLNKPH